MTSNYVSQRRIRAARECAAEHGVIFFLPIFFKGLWSS